MPIVRWVCVGIAFGLSGYFLFANVYPVLNAVSAAGPSNKCQPTALGVLFPEYLVIQMTDGLTTIL